jgi:MFS family permease
MRLPATRMPKLHTRENTHSDTAAAPVLGLRANLGQFALLVLINAFVGAMVGLERSIVPLLGQQVFGLASTSTVLSFILVFVMVKAFSNLFAGRLSDRLGRKGVLVVGWLVGLPVPFLIIFAPSWGWVVFANVLLGINQGLCWSTTVIMKIDLVGPARRGLAMGFNEAAGYGAVSLSAIAAGYLAATYALRPQPFLLGIGFALAGLVLSLFFVRESHGYARHEATLIAAPSEVAPGAASPTADRSALRTEILYSSICLIGFGKRTRSSSPVLRCNAIVT